MIDIKSLREKPEEYKSSEVRRGRDGSLVTKALDFDVKWKSSQLVLESLNRNRNVVSQEINACKKAKEEAKAKEKISEMKTVIENIAKEEEKASELKNNRDNCLKSIGNILDPSVPSGKDESENVVIKTVGKIPKFDFEVKDHIDLAEELDLIDLDTAAKVSGARFFYLKNEAVLLDMALQKYAVDLLVEEDFNPIWVPFMLNRSALEGGVNLSEFQDTIYKIEDEDLYLIGTSEHPLVALHKDDVLNKKSLPLKMCGISTCFRKEAGSHGRDDKGIFRVHQFNKIEQVMYVLPENSKKFFDYLQSLSEKIFSNLGIPYQVVNICTGDIGNKQALQYDIEAWFPGQDDGKGRFREVTSCSNCTDYQAVTLNTKYSEDSGEKKYVHMLNNTAIATSRAMAAIIENYQTKEGNIKIPKVLVPYMNGLKEIKKKKK